jgi:two-component system, chemotaxis family, CheB/CheR fusion protein
MIHLPKTSATGRKAVVHDPETDAPDVVAAVREPLPLSIPLPMPMPDAVSPVRIAGRDLGAAPRGAASGFFRDPGAFRALAELIPSLFAEKGPDEAVRVWVAGCATGEEAWSIAILLAEHAATLPHPPACQLFATDTDAARCARGRNALYLASTVAGVPTERLRRFFKWEGGGYRVSRPLREAVLFAVHDVLRDPPFDGLDLVVCRGLLSAMAPDARTRVLETFHGALRPGGVLFLGAAEPAGDGGGFAPAAEAHGIHRRDDSPPLLPAAPGGDILIHDGSRT